MTDDRVNFEKAVNFIQESGDEVMAALASYAAGTKTTTETLKVITRYQRTDGGWNTNYGEINRPGLIVDALFTLKILS